jgi:hypothetical protein
LPNAGLISEAIEIKKDNSRGYYFKMIFGFNTDPEIAKEELIKKIRRGLNRRAIEEEVKELK